MNVKERYSALRTALAAIIDEESNGEDDPSLDFRLISAFAKMAAEVAVRREISEVRREMRESKRAEDNEPLKST